MENVEDFVSCERGIGKCSISGQEPPVSVPQVKLTLDFLQVNPFQGWGFICEAQSRPTLLQGRSNGMAEFVGPNSR